MAIDMAFAVAINVALIPSGWSKVITGVLT